MDIIRDNISDVIQPHADSRPDEEAVRAGGQSLTWGRLAQSVDDATAFLAGHGIVEGELVGVALANSIEHVILLLALLRMGATPVGIPPETPPETIAAILRSLTVRVLFREPHERQPIAPLTIPIAPHWRPAPAFGRNRRAARSGENLQIVFLSSGSTGLPRAVTLTQHALLQRSRLAYPVYSRWWSQEQPGTALIASALCHAAFIQWIIQQMILGGRTVLMPAFVHGGDIVRDVAQWEDAVLRVGPNACRLFLQAAPAEGLLFPRLRFMNCTGLPLYPHEKREIIRRVTPHFSEDYGATGCGPITCLDPCDIVGMAESVGRAPPGIEIRLCDGNGAPQPPGMAGRIEVRSPGMAPRTLQTLYDGNVFEGFKDGWCRTGDVGRLNAEGYLHFIGRASECIRQDGVELYPEEIEGMLSSYPGVEDVAVVGHTPPGTRSEIAVAVVSGLRYEQRFDVGAHCATRLPADRRPRCYLFTDHLPRTPIGKIDRPAIKAYLAANPAALSS